MTDRNAKIYVAGHTGMVGSALVRRLQKSGYSNIVTRTRSELDLLEQRAVFDFLRAERPDFIFVAAAKVGGIHANNSYRAEFLYENLAIAANVIHGAHLADVQHLIFLGSSCVYPRECPQPIREEYLLTGPLESTNEPYAIAKIAGIKLCETYRQQYGRAYITAMPTNLYGPNDNYDLDTSHVLPALLRKAHEAKVRGDSEMVLWGSGNPRREFLFVDDLAEACVLLMELQSDAQKHTRVPSLINVGCGEDLTIRELAHEIKSVVGYSGGLRFDPSRPDGTPRKLLDVSHIKNLGWKPRTSLRDGLQATLEDYLSQVARG